MHSWKLKDGGTGWGPYTMGIEIYSKRLGFDENLAPNYQDRGGYSFSKGGYAYILAETGIVGFLLFGACIAHS